VLVERLWPRGVSREQAHLDLWLRDVVPSHELRAWYQHDVTHYDEFAAAIWPSWSGSPRAPRWPGCVSWRRPAR
jgi:hypothetical protein